MTHTTHSLEDVIAFLCGEAELDGRHFGEHRPDRPAFWWRKNLREAFDHYTTTKISEVLDAVEEAIGEDDRDYSQDNADEQSLKVLVATSTACNELRAELRQKLSQIRKEQS